MNTPEILPRLDLIFHRRGVEQARGVPDRIQRQVLLQTFLQDTPRSKYDRIFKANLHLHIPYQRVKPIRNNLVINDLSRSTLNAINREKVVRSSGPQMGTAPQVRSTLCYTKLEKMA